MKQTSYLVIYKDGFNARGRYFGPFVSVESAHKFMGELPEPLAGGYKTSKTIQPFTLSDSLQVRSLILGERRQCEYDVHP